jgi:DNA-directed RNA polymerase specialized sigma24 family protein
LSAEERLRAVESEVEELKDKQRRLLTLADPERHPFTYLTLEMNLTKDQVRRIFNLMDEVERSLSTSQPMHHAEFERRVYGIVPSRTGDYHFAEDIVRTLNESNQYKSVYSHMRSRGMNLR